MLKLGMKVVADIFHDLVKMDEEDYEFLRSLNWQALFELWKILAPSDVRMPPYDEGFNALTLLIYAKSSLGTLNSEQELELAKVIIERNLPMKYCQGKLDWDRKILERRSNGEKIEEDQQDG